MSGNGRALLQQQVRGNKVQIDQKYLRQVVTRR